MKKIITLTLLFLGFILSATTVSAQNTYDQMYLNLNQKQAIETQKSISFMGRTYYFGYGDELKNEYFTAGEGLNGWSSMIGVYVFKNQTDPLIAAEQMYNNLLANNQAASLAIHRFTKEPILTFFLPAPGGMELNVWRFYKNTAASEVIGMQYVRTFKSPDTPQEQNKLKSLVQSICEQFLILPKQSFIW